ncbi:hypothetical protein TRVA0_012S00452 [Trichomonascus vanleenenianus]|uniref:uncharacterized protein n=1 Tax=Trichomonascus vanleenenianus TaxID=2268995 RepID=UPI003ECB7B83
MATATPSAAYNGSNTTTANNTTPNYSFGIAPPSSGSNSLKYLYLIFLVIGVIVLLLIARIVIRKRRRERKLFKADAVRSEALRLDMERSEHLRTSSGSSQPSESGSGEWINPPPPYHQPSQPEPIYLGRSRLPVYEEIREEEEIETPSIYHRTSTATHVTN